MTVQSPPQPAAAIPQTGRAEAVDVATAQYAALLTLLRVLGDDEWDLLTDCPEWTVRDVVCHVIGALDDAWPWHSIRHVLVARRRYPQRPLLDGNNQAQLDDRRGWPSGRLVDELARLAPKGIRMRRRTPRPLRRTTKIPQLMGLPEGATVAYAMDVIYTRDAWMHRVDIARAVGRPLPAATSDGHVVGQVMRDLALTWHVAPVVLELTGPGGGSWLIGSGEPVATVRTNAVEYARLLSGRTATPAYDVDGETGVIAALDSARLPF